MSALRLQHRLMLSLLKDLNAMQELVFFSLLEFIKSEDNSRMLGKKVLAVVSFCTKTYKQVFFTGVAPLPVTLGWFPSAGITSALVAALSV